MEQGKKLIIDVDTGLDDAVALFYLLNKIPEKILGITVCGGNTDLDNALRNTLKVLSAAGIDVPVYPGERKNSLGKDFIHASDYHGKNGFVGLDNSSDLKPSSPAACDFIVQSAKTYEGSLNILCLAPPTNIAKAIQIDRSVIEKVSSVVIMGGSVSTQGNQTEFAEFNFFQDPPAVRSILENIKNIKLVTLDATGECLIRKNMIKTFFPGDDMASELLRKLVEKWYEDFGDKSGRLFELYDPLAASCFVGDFIKFKKAKLDIRLSGERVGGLTPGPYALEYSYSADNDAFARDLISSLN